MRLRDLTAQCEANAGTCRLRGEEGYEQVGSRVETPALVLDDDHDAARVRAPRHRHRAAGLERCVGRVAQQVDERLLELRTVRFDDDVRVIVGHPDLHVQPRFQVRNTLDQRPDLHRLRLRRRHARQPRVLRHQPRQRFRSVRDHVEPLLDVRDALALNQLLLENATHGARNRLDRRERVVDLVREHTHDALPCELFLFAQRARHVTQHDQLVGPAVLSEFRATQLPSACRARERVIESLCGRTLEVLRQPDLLRRATDERIGDRPDERCARPVHETQLAVRIEREDRDFDLGEDVREQGCRLDGGQPLPVQRLPQLVDLAHDVAEQVARVRARSSQRIVALAQCAKQVLQELQRADRPRVGTHRGTDPERRKEERQRPAQLGRRVVRPQQPERGSDGGQPPQQDVADDGVLEAAEAAARGHGLCRGMSGSTLRCSFPGRPGRRGRDGAECRKLGEVRGPHQRTRQAGCRRTPRRAL